MKVNKIYHGDCLDLIKGVEKDSIDLAFFDPPFKLNQKYSTSIDSDNLLAVSSIVAIAPELRRVVKQGRFCCVIYDNRILPLVMSAFRNAGWKYLRAITLYRKTGNAGIVHGWMSTSDLILLFQNGEGKEMYYGKCKHDVYVKSKLETEGFNHPAQKPLDVCLDIIQRLTTTDELVLDPYIGSGTTAVACKLLGRNFIGFDLNEDYVKVAEKRIAKVKKQAVQCVIGKETAP